MVEEFDLPQSIIDRKVTKMKMISPSNREVDVGKTLSETEYIGMCRREVFDDFLRKRAAENGAKLVNGLMMRMEQKGGWQEHAGGSMRRPGSFRWRQHVAWHGRCSSAQVAAGGSSGCRRLCGH